MITLKDVFTMVTKLVGQQEAIHARNLMADQIHTDHENRLRVLEQQPKGSDHEQRLRALERWRYAVPASVVISAGSIASGVLALLSHH